MAAVLAIVALLAACDRADLEAKQKAGGFLRPRTEGFLLPILEARYAAQNAPGKPGEESDESSRALGKLLEDKSPETDEAAVGFYWAIALERRMTRT